jgi:hypothetical protein
VRRPMRSGDNAPLADFVYGYLRVGERGARKTGWHEGWLAGIRSVPGLAGDRLPGGRAPRAPALLVVLVERYGPVREDLRARIELHPGSGLQLLELSVELAAARDHEAVERLLAALPSPPIE